MKDENAMTTTKTYIACDEKDCNNIINSQLNTSTCPTHSNNKGDNDATTQSVSESTTATRPTNISSI